MNKKWYCVSVCLFLSVQSSVYCANFFSDSDDANVHELEEYPPYAGKTVKSGFKNESQEEKKAKQKSEASSDTKVLIKLLKRNIQLLENMIKVLRQYEKE